MIKIEIKLLSARIIAMNITRSIYVEAIEDIDDASDTSNIRLF